MSQPFQISYWPSRILFGLNAALLFIGLSVETYVIENPVLVEIASFGVGLGALLLLVVQFEKQVSHESNDSMWDLAQYLTVVFAWAIYLLVVAVKLPA